VRLGLVIALVACSGRDVERLPPPPQELATIEVMPPPPPPRPPGEADYEGPELAVDAGPERAPIRLDAAFTLRRLARSRPARANTLIVAIDRGELYLVEAGASLALAPDGRLASPPLAAPATAPLIAQLAGRDGVLVLVDATTPVAHLEPLAAALRSECWALATSDGTQVTGAWPEPCPPARPPRGPELALFIEATQISLASTDSTEVVRATSGELAEKLRAHKLAELAQRTDLAIAAAGGITAGDVVDAIAIAAAEGFTAATLLPAVWLPHARVAPNARGIPLAGAVAITVGALAGELAGRPRPELERTVKARAGLYRTCYQRQLNRTPNLAKGLVTLGFTIEQDGKVTGARAVGGIANRELTDCLSRTVMLLRFPPAQGQVARVRLPLTFTWSR
jgi:hypothetical protein